MKTHRIMLLVALFLASACAFAAGPDANVVSGTAAESAFARLKSLAGEWQAVDAKGQKSTLNYQVVSAGSAVLEQFRSEALPPGSEMVTVYYLDDGQLVLTHYCMAKNQPHLRATRYNPASGELDFDFVSAGNMSSRADGHMHSAKISFIDGDHFSSDWQFVENGAPKFTETAQYARVR
jgi:hypothetical protein